MIPFETSFLFDANFEIPEGIDITFNQGGTSSSKTYSIIQVLLMKSFEKPNAISTVVGQDIPNLKKGAIRDFHTIRANSEWVDRFVKDYYRQDRVAEMTNGAIIEFNSFDNAQDAQSGKRDYLFMNEVNGISYDIFKELYKRTTIHTWADYNPTAEFWVHNKGFLDQPNTRLITSIYKHNPFLADSIVKKILAYEPTPENIAAGTADEYEWKVHGLGQLAPLEGVVFRKHEAGEFDDSLPYYYGMDFGFHPSPTTLVKVAVDKKNRKIYAHELFYNTELNNDQIIELCHKYVTKSEERIIGDAAAKSQINELRLGGVNIMNCRKAPGSVLAGIKKMQGYTIIYTPTSKNLKKELTNYIWNDKKHGIPKKEFDHLIDPIRYCFDFLAL